MPKNYRRKTKKIKRYRRSFYTPAMQVRRVISIAVLVVAVLIAAWFAAPHVLNWATHTWYTVVRDRDLEAEAASAASAAAAASSEAAAGSERGTTIKERLAASQEAAASSQAAVAAQLGPEVVEGSWAYVDVTALTDEASIRAIARQLADDGTAYALITLKDSSGNVYYASTLSAASRSFADTIVDPELVARVFKQSGVIPVAQISAFRDPIAAYTDRSLAIRYRSNGEGDYLWLDAANAAAGGKAWLNPYSSAAVEFVGDIVVELHNAGFDHVALSGVQFPTAVSAKQDFGSTGGVKRHAQLAADIHTLETRFGDAVTLWFLYGYTDCTAAPASLGGSALELGMENLIIEVPAKNTLDETARAELLQAAADAGITHTVIRDDTAAYFE